MPEFIAKRVAYDSAGLYHFLLETQKMLHAMEPHPHDVIHDDSFVTAITHVADDIYRNYTMLDSLYTIDNKNEVLSYIVEEELPISFFIECYAKASEYFGTTASLCLKIFNDPESVCYRQLSISINTDLNLDEALEKLNRFDEEWWLDRLSALNGNICIDVNFS